MDTVTNIATVDGFLILFDILAGVIAAAKNRELDSSVMRDGMYNKLGEVLFLALSMACGFWLTQPPFASLGVPADVASVVAVYIAGMELLSIVENICKINPDIPIAKVLAIFNIDTEGADDVESGRASEE